MNRHRFRARCLSFLLLLVVGSSCGGEAPAPPHAAARTQAEGLGLDGELTVNTSGRVLNRYAVLGADANPGNTILTLSNSAGQGLDALAPLGVGDLLLIIQMQGAEIGGVNAGNFGEILDISSAGRYEFIDVVSVNSASNRIVVNSGCSGLKNRYQTSGHVQVIRVPQYSNLTVVAPGTVVAPPWDGQRGGVVALQVAGTLRIDSTIDVSGSGFRGGEQNPILTNRLPNVGSFYLSMNAQDGGNRGEGIAGFANDYAALGQYGRGAAANGGGGGNRVGAGGGGGGNGGLVTDWNGQGEMPANVTGGGLAWPLDPNYAATQGARAGGGRGGYSLSSAVQDPTAIGPGAVSWGLDQRRERGGLGGRPVPNDPSTALFLGGGGGGGDDFMNSSGAGGRGGGILFVDAQQISGSGQILANGAAGGDATDTSSGAGGGGAGGTVVLAAASVAGISVQANGGAGGSQALAAPMAGGPGGGGGGGYVGSPSGSTITRQVAGGAGGTTLSTDMTQFPRNGATSGVLGSLADSGVAPFAGAPFCSVADLAISMSAAPIVTQRLEAFTVQVMLQNNGPSRTGNVVVQLDLPPGVRLTGFQPTGSPSDGWDCRVAGQRLSCTQANLLTGGTASFSANVVPAIGAAMMTFAASATAPSTDPDPGNNQVTLTVGNSDPLDIRLAGGGYGCAVTRPVGGPGGVGAPVGGGPGSGGAALLLLGAVAAWRRRRLGSSRG